MPRTATNPNSKVFPCPYCDLEYKSVNSVYAHVQAKHPGKKYSKKMVKNLPNHKKPTNVPDTDKLEQVLKDLKMSFADDEIDLDTYMVQKKLIESKLAKIKKNWEIDNQYEKPPTLDFKILESTDEIEKYIIEHDLYHRLLNLTKNLEYGKAFLLLFTNNIKITNDDKYDEAGDLLYTATYMYDGQPKIEKDLTTEEFWVFYNKFIIGVTSMVLKQFLKAGAIVNYQSEEYIPSESLTDHQQEEVQVSVSEKEHLNECYADLCMKTVQKYNSPIKDHIDLVLPRFNHCLKI